MKVILTVIDGLSDSLMNNFLYNLPTFYKISKEGTYGSLESSYPSITPVALASLFTGLLPKNNGVTAPKIFIKGRKIYSPLLAYTSYSLSVDPIWKILGENKYKVLVTSAPQALPDRWKLDNVVLFDPYRSRIKKFSKGETLIEGENNIAGDKWTVKKDGNVFYISFPGTKISEIKLENGQWSEQLEFIAKIKDKEVKGITFLHARQDDIYMTPPAFLIDWSNKNNILQNVWNNVVLKYGMVLDGDYKSLSKGIITFEEYLKTAELAFNFFYEYTKYLLSNLEWDFAITYLPTVDNFQHLLYGINDSKSLDYIFRAYQYADNFVEMNISFADNIFVCSDHGIAKVKKKVYINKILEKINILKIDNNKIDWRKTKAYYGGGGIIRINLKGREDGGIVKINEFPKLVNYIVKNLEKITDGEEKVFTRIYQKQQPAGDREGDIEIGVNDFYSISSDIEKDNEIEDVIPYRTITADHGYYRKEDLYGVVFAYGKNIIKNNKKISAKIVDITPTILKLFGITQRKTDGIPLQMIKNELQNPKQKT
ncbi:nucleotide pyrophosphatase [Acidianus sulfidivorans JP7]|uniref:Nucleotide pyrophosphatase n=1 Tax=Acidianus sulfidivorans JP7 TaxID=619593 RepID=A0A2U9IMW4_9CREN|nr:alkaline phosphatase family protein [Acidianus sulfidivorans]AWR97340.1 nucleotide pyrophosphatase [Acidianus sulfidivorans JP7]